MHAAIKNSIVSLFLLLFLFPAAEKQLHAFEHDKKEHCNAADKHFHSLEHHCAVCDFTFSASDPVPEKSITFINNENSFLYCPYSEQVNAVAVFRYLPARAPPFIC